MFRIFLRIITQAINRPSYLGSFEQGRIRRQESCIGFNKHPSSENFFIITILKYVNRKFFSEIEIKNLVIIRYILAVNP